jgi:hypothetical protein
MLSLQQQNIIQDSLWVVNTILKKQGLQSDEDLRQSSIAFMCECLQRYDPNKCSKWTTYAYKNIYMFVKRQNSKRQKLDSQVFNLTDLGDDFVADNSLGINAQPKMDNRCLLKEIYSNCTPEEKTVLQMRLRGLSLMDIAISKHSTIDKVRGVLRRIKRNQRGKSWTNVFGN